LKKRVPSAAESIDELFVEDEAAPVFWAERDRDFATPRPSAGEGIRRVVKKLSRPWDVTESAAFSVAFGNAISLSTAWRSRTPPKD
jgi:hypothetical protein